MLRLIPILLLLSSTLFAQKEDYIWHLGKDQQPQEGIQAMQVDFNKNSFHVEVRDFPVGFHHNNQAICDKNGALLFYTNGCAIVNRNHEIMPNGHRMNWDSLFTAVIGWNEDCRLGYPGTQNLLILDDPGYEHGYYLFHKPGVLENIRENIFFEFRMSYVDMQLDNGLGDVVFVDSLLLEEEIPMWSYLSAVKHQNGKDWWILQPLLHTNTISKFLLDHNGIHRVSDQEVSIYFSEIESESRGTARFSPDGSQYAFFNRQDNLHLYDFDRETGNLFNHQLIEVFNTPIARENYKFGSVEWSSSGRMLYTCVDDSLYQIDTWAENLEDGIQFIDQYNGTLDPFPTTFRIMSLAPDCKIYMCSGNGSDSYHVIHNPELVGKDCDFVQNGIKLPQHAGSANLPLPPRWRVDEEDKCDSTISSFFGQLVYYKRELLTYPNPSTGVFNIEVPQQKIRSGTLEIYDRNGQLIKLVKGIAGNNMRMDLSALPSGVYHLELYPENNKERVFYRSKVVLVK